MADTNTLGRLLVLLSRLETAAYDFYDEFREYHDGDPERGALVADILADEAAHARVVREITASLARVRLDAPVPAALLRDLEDILEMITERDEDLFASADNTCMVIERMESLEFDVVLSFVNVSEIRYEFTRDYLANQSVDHTNKVYQLLRSLC